MTLYQIVDILKSIALTQPNIQSATDGSIYDVMNTNPSVKYDVFHISQTTHQSDEETDYYGFNIFFVSRLEDSLEDNRLQIQSIGKEILDNILRTFCENWGIDFPIITYTPFTQKFNDLCAGCYCNVRIEVPKELICADDYMGEVVPVTPGIKLQDLAITITQNGTRVITPSAGFDGIGEITITTDVPGYDEGYDDGVADQLAKLTATAFTANGEYGRVNGWSAVTVNVPATEDRYEEGYEDGEAAQKAKLSAITISANGQYDRADGYSAITVNVPSDYQEGYDDGKQDGIDEQKAKLTITSFTQNDTYTRADGWSAVTVNVPDRYDEGYDDGYADGFAAGASACSGFFITAITLNVPSAITDNGTATTTYSPSAAYTDIYYTSSDPTKAIIDSETGAITVIADGNVIICTKDRYTGLQDCKTVAVTKTPTPGDYIMAIYEVTSTTQETRILGDSGLSYFATGQLTDGTNVPIATGFTFPQTGRQVVKYTLTGNSLGYFPFGRVYQLVEITIPSAVTSLGREGTFWECEGLTAVTLPNTITSFPDRAFGGCISLSSLTIPNSVRSLGEGAMVTMPALTSVTIPSSVTSIDIHCFGNSPTGYTAGLTVVTIDNFHNNSSLVPSQSTNQRWGLTIASTEQADGLLLQSSSNMVVGCRPSATTVTIPSGYTGITSSCFQFCRSCTSITVPDSIQRLGPGCFSQCPLTSITLNGVTVIGAAAFMNSKLKTINIGSHLLQIENQAFNGAGELRRLYINRETPPELGAYSGISENVTIYVPRTAEYAYKTATNWSAYANQITGISF